MNREVYYYGSRGGGTGHAWWSPDGPRIDNPSTHGIPWDLPPENDLLPGAEDPMTSAEDGDAQLTVFEVRGRTFTAMSFWDSVVEGVTRGTSIFLSEGARNFEEMEELSKSEFPKIWSRRARPVTLIRYDGPGDEDRTGQIAAPLEEAPEGESEGPTVEMEMLDRAEREGLETKGAVPEIDPENVEAVFRDTLVEVTEWERVHVEVRPPEDERGEWDVRIGPGWGLTRVTFTAGEIWTSADEIVEDAIVRAKEDLAEHNRAARQRNEMIGDAAARPPEPDGEPDEEDGEPEAPEAPSEEPDDEESPSDAEAPEEESGGADAEEGADDDEGGIECPSCGESQEPPTPEGWDGEPAIEIPCEACGATLMIGGGEGPRLREGDPLLEE